MFDSEFVARVETVLTERCVGGATVKVPDLCTELGLDPAFASAMSLLVKGGACGAGWEVRKGPSGGIGRVGEKPARKVSAPTTAQLPGGFAAACQAALDTLCDGKSRVTRDTVARHLGMAGSKTEAWVSLALKTGAVSGYAAHAGRNGGISRVAVLSADGADETPAPAPEPAPEPETLEAAPAPAPEPEAAPETPKKKGKAKGKKASK